MGFLLVKESMVFNPFEAGIPVGTPITAILVGGGGGGGGARRNYNGGRTQFSGGGGAGELKTALFKSVNETLLITVGAKGIGGPLLYESGTGEDGGNGGTTSIGTIASAIGGKGGGGAGDQGDGKGGQSGGGTGNGSDGELCYSSNGEPGSGGGGLQLGVFQIGGDASVVTSHDSSVATHTKGGGLGGTEGHFNLGGAGGGFGSGGGGASSPSVTSPVPNKAPDAGEGSTNGFCFLGEAGKGVVILFW